MAQRPTELADRVEAVRALAELYRYERLTYLVICLISTAMLLYSCCVLLANGKADAKTLIALFGSSGIVTTSVGLSLKVWNDSVKKVFG